MHIVSVIPLKKGFLKEELTYFTGQEINIGDIVTVSIRNRKILGLVASINEATNIKSDIKNLQFNLKKIIEIKEKSIFSKEFIESVFLTGKYFVSKNNNSMTALIPAILREEYDKISKFYIDKISPSLEQESSLKNNQLSKNIKAEKLLFQTQFEDRISFYKTLIRGSFAQKKSIFIVLPTEKYIEEFSQLLEKGIESFVIPIHGGFSTKKQLKKIEQIITSLHPVLIIGTAPYLSLPRQDLETIILEHENSNAYKMIAKPHFDLRTYVEIFASKINAKLIFGDFLLQYETIARKELDNFSEIHPLSYRTNFSGKIKVISKESPVLTTHTGTEKEKFRVLKEESIKDIKNTILNKENVFVFSLRRGLATITVCRDCNEPVMCKKCSAPLVLYISRDGKKRMFSCNRCKEEMSPETTCSNCKSWNLIPLGIGTDTVYEEIKKNLPGVKIFKLDKESAKTNKEAEKIISDFENCQGAILIGTEMTFFYLKNKVPLSVIASLDSLWSIPNFRMGERIIQLIISIIEKTEKNLIIETKNEDDRAIKAITTENLLTFVREELKDRAKLGYPPYVRFIKITHLGDKEKTINAKKILLELLKEYNPQIFSGFIAKEKGKYSTNTLIKLESRKWSLAEISIGSLIDQNLFEKLTSLPLNFSINIDPEDLL